MMQIKNPKIPIKPLSQDYKGINLVQALEDLNGRLPDFGYLSESVEYDNSKRGWQLISDIMQPRSYNTKFWRLVNRLMEVKNQYN